MASMLKFVVPHDCKIHGAKVLGKYGPINMPVGGPVPLESGQTVYIDMETHLIYRDEAGQDPIRFESAPGMADGEGRVNVLGGDPVPVFDYTEWKYRNYMLGKEVILLGRNIPMLAENDRWSHPILPVYVDVNGHARRNNYGGQCAVLYHTVVANPALEVSDFFDQTSRIGVDFAFLNLVDGAYESGANEIPAYAKTLSALDYYYLNVEDRTPPQIGYFAQGEWMDQNPYGPQYEWLNTLHKKYQCKLFTGLVALAHIMRTPCRQIAVLGMDMFVDRTNANPDAFVESHSIRGNLNFIVDAIQDPRVTIDTGLLNALKRYGVL